MNVKDKEQLVIDLLNGELDNQEFNSTLHLIKTDQDFKKLFIQFRDIYIASGIILNDKINFRENELNNISRMIFSKRLKVNFFQNKWVRIAAIVLLIIGLGMISQYYVKLNNSNSKLFTEHIVPLGSKVSVFLNDGTQVWLNAGSKLKYYNNFGKRDRTVYLEGEGFFDVTKNKKCTFIVKTKNINVYALGTKFNVKAYPDDNIIETTLIEGLVKVEKSAGSKIYGLDEGLYLKPNQSLNIRANMENNEGLVPEKKETNFQEAKINKFINIENVNVYSSWKDDIWEFKGESLESLAKKLERKYDVTIIFKNHELKQFTFTGKLKNEPLEQVMKAIELSSRVKIDINGRNVTIENN